jgi:CRISPR/Cas system CMR-associated protein Cmr3 (group 5 of RAMP superfamily)
MDAKSETRILGLKGKLVNTAEKGETCGFRMDKPGYKNFTYYCVYSAEA